MRAASRRSAINSSSSEVPGFACLRTIRCARTMLRFKVFLFSAESLRPLRLCVKLFCFFTIFYFPTAFAPLNCHTKNSIIECGSFVPPFNRSSASRSALNPSNNRSFEIFRAH
jgi:hypothetical protein